MDPQQQYPPTSPGNPYEFILNPEKPKKPGKFGLGGNKLAMTLVFIVGGVLIFMILATILLNAFTPKKIDEAQLTSLAQTQVELHRISKKASSEATQQVTRNLATTVEYTMMTQKTETLKVLAENGVELGDKELALKQNATTDQKFATAKSTSTFDKTYTEIIETELTTYANTLKQLTTLGSSQKERDRISDYYQQVQQLISQIPYAQDKIDSGDTAPTPAP